MVIQDSKSSCGMLRQGDCRKFEMKPSGQSEFQPSLSYIKPCFLIIIIFSLKSQDWGKGGTETPPLLGGQNMCAPQSCKETSVMEISFHSRHGPV